MWWKKVSPKVTHQFIITVGLLSLVIIIVNGILMYHDILPSWCGWFNFPLMFMTIFFIPWGVEKWLND